MVQGDYNSRHPLELGYDRWVLSAPGLATCSHPALRCHALSRDVCRRGLAEEPHSLGRVPQCLGHAIAQDPGVFRQISCGTLDTFVTAGQTPWPVVMPAVTAKTKFAKFRDIRKPCSG